MLLIFQHRNEISKLHGTSTFSWDFCVATIIAIYFSAKLVTDVVLLSLDYEYLKKKKKERKREKCMKEIVVAYLQTRKELYGLGKRKINRCSKRYLCRR